MLCLAIVQLAARTGPSPSSQELSKLEPPSDDVPPGTTASQAGEQAVPESELPDLAMGIEELRGHPDWKRFPIDPVTDAEAAVSFCARNCSSIPRISFWDVPPPIMFERGATCRPSGCDWGTPTPTAEEQHKSLVQRLGLDSHTRIAIVGSSGSLRHAKYGAEIDSHDVVVRVNGAPCGTIYADMVGQKIDVDYTAPEAMLKFHKYVQAEPNGTMACGIMQKQPVAVVFQSFGICASSEERAKHASWARDYIPPGTTSAPGDEASGMWTVDPDWGCALWRDELNRAESHFPSTGMNAAGFFANLARSLGAPAPSVYGYGGDTQGCEKYYDCRARGIDYSSNAWHPFAAEHKALQAWNEAGHIVLKM